MSAKGLARLYDRLTPRERLPLIFAASARGDEVEAERLARSAPTTGYSLPDYYGLSDGLLLLNLFHVVGALELAALYWQTSGMLRDADESPAEGDEPLSDCAFDTLRACAYLLVTHLDGWRHLAAELHLDPERLLANMPGYGTVRRAEEAARHLAATADETTAWMRRHDPKAGPAPTAEDKADGMRRFLEWREKWWG